MHAGEVIVTQHVLAQSRCLPPGQAWLGTCFFASDRVDGGIADRHRGFSDRCSPDRVHSNRPRSETGEFAHAVNRQAGIYENDWIIVVLVFLARAGAAS